MTRFLERVPVFLTPLTPVHVGCGQDFEPTNYVIEDDALYEFEPARLLLSDADRRSLVQGVNMRGDEAIRAVQRFFHQRRTACRSVSRLKVLVARGVGEQYESRIGRVAQRETSGRTVSNLLAIERTTHHPYTGQPYLPGSGLKGAMRTAWLSSRRAGSGAACDPERGSGRKASDVEQRILGGSFSSDPFRLVAVADASGGDVASRVVFALNRRKDPSSDKSRRPVQKGPPICCEVIGEGQLRCFSGEIRFLRP